VNTCVIVFTVFFLFSLQVSEEHGVSVRRFCSNSFPCNYIQVLVSDLVVSSEAVRGSRLTRMIITVKPAQDGTRIKRILVFIGKSVWYRKCFVTSGVILPVQ
jgi:hypothetical protein